NTGLQVSSYSPPTSGKFTRNRPGHCSPMSSVSSSTRTSSLAEPIPISRICCRGWCGGYDLRPAQFESYLPGQRRHVLQPVIEVDLPAVPKDKGIANVPRSPLADLRDL